ncbi:MAG: hypothetical protein WCT03_20675 [Candidatus Obscuribacterales bacterium]
MNNPLLQAFNEKHTGKPEETVWASILSHMYAWSIPTEPVVTQLTELSPIVELGAGTGYWASLLQAAGAQIRAFDKFPLEHGNNGYHLLACTSFFPVVKGTERVLDDYSKHTLFLCWPTPDFADKALQRHPGSKLIYIGQPNGGLDGATGGAIFHQYLAQFWQLEREIILPRWTGRNDSCFVYSKQQ